MRPNCNGCGRFISKKDFEDNRATHTVEGDGDDEGDAFYHYDCASGFDKERMDKARQAKDE